MWAFGSWRVWRGGLRGFFFLFEVVHMTLHTTGGIVGRGLGQGEPTKKKTLRETYTLEVASERFTKLITSLKTAEEESTHFGGPQKETGPFLQLVVPCCWFRALLIRGL